MDVVYVRHKLSSTSEILEDLWSKRLIAIHYLDIPSTNPDDYPVEGKSALKRLWEYCEIGVIAAASFREIRPTTILIGKIVSGSKISTPKYGKYIYKTVHLEDVMEVSYNDYPLLSAIQPRQGTICKWHAANEYINAIYFGKPLPWSVNSLLPSQLEVLCYEYMRQKRLLLYLLMPIGRTRIDVDIQGIDGNSNAVIAQVTHSNNRLTINNKLKVLLNYHYSDTKLFFFGPKTKKVSVINIEYITIEDVFNYFAESEKKTVEHTMLRKMIYKKR